MRLRIDVKVMETVRSRRRFCELDQLGDYRRAHHRGREAARLAGGRHAKTILRKYRTAAQPHIQPTCSRTAQGKQMPQAKGVREVGWVDCAGGGQITVEKGIAYVGHMSNPHGTSLFDVRDPRNAKQLSTI